MEESNEYNRRRQERPDRIYLKYQSSQVEGQCIMLSISPVRLVEWRYALFLIFNTLLFIPYLLTHWFPQLTMVFYYKFCSLEQATDFHILNYDKQPSIVAKRKKSFMLNQSKSAFYMFFVNRYMTYIIDENEIVRVSMYDFRERISHIISSKKQEKGLSDCQAHQLKNSYGPGTMIVEKPSCVDITVGQISRPLYLLLIFSVAYWTFNLKYFYFAGILFFISAIGLSINLFQTLHLSKKIFSMAYYNIPLNVLREGKIEVVASIDVVPGDIVFLKDPIKLPFEGIILEGSALINECALTGESVPVVKKADAYEVMADQKQPINKSSFIFQGTTVIQINDKKKMSRFQKFRQQYGIPVCVVKTNFLTTKGQLVRIILFPKQLVNIFQRQSYKYLLFVFCLTVATYIAIIAITYKYTTASDLIQKFVIMLTITIPPQLPVSMTFGIIYAVDRLSKKGIYCIQQNKVITGGSIELCCFDKTGTLTQDYMDLYSIVPAHQGRFHPLILNNQTTVNKTIEDSARLPFLFSILSNMASNNSIIKIEATNELIGDPMEVKAFQFGKYRLNQSHSDPNVVFAFESDRGHFGVVYRRFQFDSDLQRMSVIIRNSGSKDYQAYCKGSPEIMLNLMERSGIPPNYSQVLKEYASQGFRVLTIASKNIEESDLGSITRVKTESELVFNGFLVFENKLKPETKGAIVMLKTAEIGCVMITGDSTLTGSNISYKCGISDNKKGMIICHFQDGHFIEDRFQHVRDLNQKAQVQIKNSYYTEIEIQNNTNVTQIAFDNLELDQQFPNQAGTTQNNPQRFMQGMIRKANKKNSHICLTGAAFNELFQGTIKDLTALENQFMELITVFARTKPNDKAKIVMALQHMDKKVSMCGDGANDCGALKQADIGLSLSQAEASISAPFTSQVANITSMVQLIKECRGGLATNFSLFNVLSMYTLIQYTTSAISQRYLQNPADFQYLYWDLFLNFLFMLFIGFTKTADELTVDRPRSSLFGVLNLFQMLTAFIIQAVGQISAIAIYQTYNSSYYWANGGIDNAINNYNTFGVFLPGFETSILFVFINNVYLATIIAFNISRPWRQHFFTNIPLMAMIILALLNNHIVFFWPAGTWVNFRAEICLPHYGIRWILFGASWGFSLSIIILQKCIFEPLSMRLLRKYPQYKWL